MSSILALKGSEVHLYGAEWSSKEKKILRISCYVPPVGPPLQRPVTGSRADSPLEVGTHWQILLC